LMIVFNIINFTLKVPENNLTLFWVVPSILSSVQLFYFGTFLPHQEPQAGYIEPHRAQSTPLPVFWSFITCYHFGYHQEHHEYPHVPWWQLPAVYQARTKASVA
ncbi:MAG TPA: fatty acid desaturase, partial [Candidatus Caenarcaniphilales bacterium]